MANHEVDRREAPSGAAGSEPFSVPLTESDRQQNPYPLRGRPYRYDLPYEPVASDEMARTASRR